MIWGRKALAALIVRLERRLGLPQLRAQQSTLVGLAEQILAQTNRLDAGFSATHSRLETGLALLAEQILAQTNRLDAGLSANHSRLETDLVLLADHIRQLGGNATQLAGFTQNLDQNVAQNFAGLGRRLETDLVTLAKTTHDLVESSRHAAGTLAKLAADQIQFGDRARHGGDPARSGPVAKGPPIAEPPLLLLINEAELPVSIHGALAARGLASDTPSWRLEPSRLPQTQEGLPGWIDIMAACRAALNAGERLVWAEPAEADPLLAECEVEQVLGLIGPVDGIFEAKDEGRSWRVAVATRRIEGAGVALRWSLPALEALHIRLRPLADEMLERLGLGKAVHAVDLPEPGADVENWARLLPSFLAAIAKDNDVCIGVALPARYGEALETIDDSLVRLRQALRESGKKEQIAFQWVRGSVSIADSSSALAFARRHGIRFDLTPVSRRTPESRLAAYNDRVPYLALDFDLRAPFLGAGPGEVVEIPRWSGRACEIALASRDARRSLVDFFEDDFTRDAGRLARVLDRAGQKQFELQVNLDAGLIDYWPQYFVHNWAPPAPVWLRMFEFDAAELFATGSPLVRLGAANRIDNGDPRFLGGAQFFAAAAKRHTPILAEQDPKQLQIGAHAYQSERRAMTADAERLIAWMPEQLGAVLELGSGLGLMARRLRPRANRYVGIDLTIDQASAVRAAGAAALVGDIHQLAFADSSFDTIVADNVLEHAVDPMRALRECHRVLKPDGQGFFIIPPDYIAFEFANRAHLWKADAASVREALQRAGFRVMRQETVRLAELGVPGAYPSSDGKTGLWQASRVR